MSEFVAIVLSAGTGSRMKSDIPKQYMDLNGYPVIYYSLKAFEDSEVSSIILVTGEADVEYCKKEIVDKYNISKVKAVVPGGKERYDSVYAGLKAIGNADYVMIHDGARPMLNSTIIERTAAAVEQEKACVVGMPVKDTIKIADDAAYCDTTPDRRRVWQIQTPQAFDYQLVLGAYDKLYADVAAVEAGLSDKVIPAITDDAMVVEYATDYRVKLVEGSYENIKITTPEDIKIAQLFLNE